MDWRHDALCAELANAGLIDHDLFFPVGTTGPAATQTAQAKAVCAECPVRDACLEWALDTGQHAGVFGGLDEQERRAVRRREHRPRPAPYATGLPRVSSRKRSSSKRKAVA